MYNAGSSKQGKAMKGKDLKGLSDADLQLLDNCLDMWHLVYRDSKPEFGPGPDEKECAAEKKLHMKIKKRMGDKSPHDDGRRTE